MCQKLQTGLWGSDAQKCLGEIIFIVYIVVKLTRKIDQAFLSKSKVLLSPTKCFIVRPI